MDDTSRFITALERLHAIYPDTPSMLNYRTPFELLVGVILSAQTTDEQVNSVLPRLFERYPDAHALAGADIHEVEQIIRSVGFFRQKAKSIVDTATLLVAEHGGAVPDSMETLTRLRGVGRKSAGVILLHVYDVPAIIVDTHFSRLVQRLGFSGARDPGKLERDVAAVLPREYWNSASMRLNYHGRRFCFARKPACRECVLSDICPAAFTAMS